jgi:hypothetical protein
MSKRQSSRRRSGPTILHFGPEPLTFAEAWNKCPFRTLIGNGVSAEEMLGRVRCTIALIDQKPGPLPPHAIAGASVAVDEGKTILLMSDSREVRDHAKRELDAMIGPRGGHA